jgi:hypothetical protein
MIVKRRRRGKFGFLLTSLRLATTSGRQRQMKCVKANLILWSEWEGDHELAVAILWIRGRTTPFCHLPFP